MPDVTGLLRSSGDPIGHPSVISGYVSRSRTAPVAFSDPIFLIATNHSEDRPYGPCAWPAIHGSTKPVQGDPVVFVMDDNNAPYVVWWGTGSTAFTGTSPTGTAGGDLTGSYPSPTFSTQGLGKMLRPGNNLSDLGNATTALKALGFTFGAFTTGTGTINVAGTGDWTVGTLAAGKATITFPTRATTPTVLPVIATDGTYNGYAELVNVNASTALVWTLNAQTAPPALVNAIVFFAVCGL